MNLITGLIIGGIVLAIIIWSRKSLVPVETARRLLSEGALIIDVRSPEEYQESRVSGAINIPGNELAEKLPLHVKDKNKPLLLHCLSGGRSSLAKHQAKALGYTQVHNLGSIGRAREIVEIK